MQVYAVFQQFRHHIKGLLSKSTKVLPDRVAPVFFDNRPDLEVICWNCLSFCRFLTAALILRLLVIGFTKTFLHRMLGLPLLFYIKGKNVGADAGYYGENVIRGLREKIKPSIKIEPRKRIEPN